MTGIVRKFASADVVVDAALGPRQIRVIANSGQSDRVKDILVAKGCKLENYLRNPIVLAQHNPEHPIGNFAPEVKNERLEGILTFAPEGISPKADEYCGLYKAGVLKTVSVGFSPIDSEPNKAGGELFKAWELLELSCVSVPCDAGAVTVARALPEKIECGALKVGASRNLPVGDDDAWDGGAAEKSIFDHCGFDGDKPDLSFARKGFLSYDASKPGERGSYKFPFAKIIDGHLTAIPSGIRAAALSLSKASIPDEAMKKARAVVDHYEAKMKTKTVAPKIKGLYEVAQLAYALHSLGYLHDDAIRESQMEGDGSKVPGMLANALKVLADAFLAMTQEEVAELLAGHDVDVSDDDDYVLAAPTPQTKALRAAFKAGAVLSGENAKHVGGIIKCFGKATDCVTKALDSHGTTHDALQSFADHIETGVGHTKALMQGRSDMPPDQRTHIDGVAKCFGKMMDVHTNALDGHDKTSDQLAAVAEPIKDGVAHAKALKRAGKPKPKPADGEATGDDETGDTSDDDSEPDVELAQEIAHRKRMIEIAELAA